MDRSQLINFAIFAALVVAFLLWKRAGQIDSAEAHRLVQEGAKLVDVRSPGEFAAGHIAGAVNIPVDDLRERLAEVQPGAIVHCQVGLRGYIAARLLNQLGKNVRNLDGGYRTWARF